jgi:uncharacterized membrane protein
MKKRTAALTLLIAWCTALFAVRVMRSGTLKYAFLPWNLFLAFIPLYASTMLQRARAGAAQVGWLVMWLLFLPNAPYIVTDFVHLRQRPFIPLWYDIALLACYAATGLLLGYASVADVQRWVSERYGETKAWLCSAVALVLCGAGIYIGRFLRWNSWDALINPIELLASIRGRVVSVTLVYGLALLVGYLAFRAFSSDERGQSSEALRQR